VFGARLIVGIEAAWSGRYALSVVSLIASTLVPDSRMKRLMVAGCTSADAE
jgi:hypothetical protein